MCVVRDCVGTGLPAMAILNTPMQLARFDGVLEIAIAGKPAPTGVVCCPRLRRSRLAGDGDFNNADAAGGFGCVLEIAIASKPAPTGDGSVDYAGAVATMSSIEAPASALRR
jgi:hypothetical protein